MCSRRIPECKLRSCADKCDFGGCKFCTQSFGRFINLVTNDQHGFRDLHNLRAQGNEIVNRCMDQINLKHQFDIAHIFHGDAKTGESLCNTQLNGRSFTL